MLKCNGVVQFCALCRVISGSSKRILTFLVLNRSLRVVLSGRLVCERALCSSVMDWCSFVLCAG